MNSAAYLHTPIDAGSQPQYGVGDIALFRTFQTAAEAQAITGDPIGIQPSSLDVGPKYWADPAAAAAMSTDPYASYTYGITKSDGTQSIITLPARVAGSFNFFPSSYAASGQGAAYDQRVKAAAEMPPVPVPTRALDATKEKIQVTPMGLVILSLDTVAAQAGSGGFSIADRQLLQAIAHKLGV